MKTVTENYFRLFQVVIVCFKLLKVAHENCDLKLFQIVVI